MGPEDDFTVEPGRVWLIPVDENGVEGERVDISEPLPSRTFHWEEYPGSDGGLEEGLEGGLRGWPDGARTHEALKSWSMSMDVSAENFEWFMAALLGKTVEEYRDLVRWNREAQWLKALTGENWGTFE